MAALTAAVLRVEVLVDGVQKVLLLAAMLPGSQDVPNTLVQEGVLALGHGGHTGGLVPDQTGFYRLSAV